MRVESGYQKLVLFGVSYGTKVALDYAAKYPANVEALVLDSVVPPEGSDVLNVSTLQGDAAARSASCARNGACNGHHRERRPRPVQPRAQARPQDAAGQGQHARRGTASR